MATVALSGLTSLEPSTKSGLSARCLAALALRLLPATLPPGSPAPAGTTLLGEASDALLVLLLRGIPLDRGLLALMLLLLAGAPAAAGPCRGTGLADALEAVRPDAKAAGESTSGMVALMCCACCRMLCRLGVPRAGPALLPAAGVEPCCLVRAAGDAPAPALAPAAAGFRAAAADDATAAGAGAGGTGARLELCGSSTTSSARPTLRAEPGLADAAAAATGGSLLCVVCSAAERRPAAGLEEAAAGSGSKSYCVAHGACSLLGEAAGCALTVGCPCC